MQIWVDADACPAVIKEILFRAADRTGVLITLVANQPMPLPPSTYLRLLQVPAGFNMADEHIIASIAAGDLVVTADIPLAASVIDKGGLALNPRGELYTRENVRERLSMRNYLEELRSSGIATGGPGSFSARDRQAFARELDRWLARWVVKPPRVDPGSA